MARPLRTIVAGLVLGAAGLAVAPFGVTSTAAYATDVTNPAQHPYPITVTIDGQTYHDGLDTLPGYDDYSCVAIPDVVYDFPDNEIDYYDDQGNLLAVAPWTEWQRIPSYQTWLNQQNGTSGSKSSSSGSSSSSFTSTGSASPGGSSTSPTTLKAATSGIARIKVGKVAGTVVKAPTSKLPGIYRVTIAVTTEGLNTVSGKATIVLRDGSISKTINGEIKNGALTVFVPKLSRGTWKVTISWPGDTNYLAVSATGSPITVTK
jgi:hypothetical protein